ncbi:TPA: hypothetical protein ACH3X3_003991 [Trebouxia sp. C0006]
MVSQVGVRPWSAINICSKTAMLFRSLYAHGASLHAALALTHASSSCGCLSYNWYFRQSLGSLVLHLASHSIGAKRSQAQTQRDQLRSMQNKQRVAEP